MAKITKAASLEEKLEQLRKLTAALEKGDQSLDKALSEFETGISLYRDCLKLIEDAERRVKRLVGDEETILESDSEVLI